MKKKKRQPATSGVKNVDDLSHCPECNMKWHYVVEGKTRSKIMGHEDPKIYDGICEWSCPGCGARWDRFSNKLIRKGSKDGQATG